MVGRPMVGCSGQTNARRLTSAPPGHMCGARAGYRSVRQSVCIALGCGQPGGLPYRGCVVEVVEVAKLSAAVSEAFWLAPRSRGSIVSSRRHPRREQEPWLFSGLLEFTARSHGASSDRERRSLLASETLCPLIISAGSSSRCVRPANERRSTWLGSL
jgi:hypothetical protein